MSWFDDGHAGTEESYEQAQRETEARRAASASQAHRDFFMDSGGTAEVIVLDGPQFHVKRHDLKFPPGHPREGKRGNTFTCCSGMTEGVDCPACIHHPRSLTDYWPRTVIDCRSYKSEKTGKVYQYEKKILPLKYKAAGRMKEKEETEIRGKVRGPLAGRVCMFNRPERNDPSTGYVSEVLEPLTEDELSAMIQKGAREPILPEFLPVLDGMEVPSNATVIPARSAKRNPASAIICPWDYRIVRILKALKMTGKNPASFWEALNSEPQSEDAWAPQGWFLRFPDYEKEREDAPPLNLYPLDYRALFFPPPVDKILSLMGTTQAEPMESRPATAEAVDYGSSPPASGGGEQTAFGMPGGGTGGY